MARRRANGFLSDFQKFIAQGNVVELAVAVIIGGAFGKIVSSLVDNIIMPCVDPIMKIFGSDWKNIAIGATKFKEGVPQDGIRIGLFLGSLIDFLIIAFVIFVMVRAIERFKRKEEVAAAAEPAPPDLSVESQERLTDALERLTRTIESRRTVS